MTKAYGRLLNCFRFRNWESGSTRKYSVQMTVTGLRKYTVRRFADICRRVPVPLQYPCLHIHIIIIIIIIIICTL